MPIGKVGYDADNMPNVTLKHYMQTGRAGINKQSEYS